MNKLLLKDVGKVCMCKRVLKEQTLETGEIPFYKISTFGAKADTYISKRLYNSLRKNFSFPKKGDILISAAGTIGKTVIYNGEPGYFQDSNIVWIDNDEKKVINSYLYYFYQTKPWMPTNGSTIKRIYNDNLRQIKITFPRSINAQQKIAAVLSALDDKIELNNKINAELEAMAKTLYDYWFVQFDFPDANDKPYKSSGGKMVYNEELKREIPEGWEVKSLQDFGDFKNGINYDPKEEGDCLANIINVRDISNSNIFINENELDVIELKSNDVKKYLVNDKSIIIARSGIPGATRLIAHYKKNTIYCGFIIHLEVEDILWKNIVFFNLKDFENNVTSQANGTIMKNVNQQVLRGLKIFLPQKLALISKFNDFINSVFSQMNNLAQQNQELSNLRDWLLPMLMNGQVSVSDAYEKVEQVLSVAAEDESSYSNQTN